MKVNQINVFLFQSCGKWSVATNQL